MKNNKNDNNSSGNNKINICILLWDFQLRQLPAKVVVTI